MTERLNYFATSPKAMDILLEQESYLRQQFNNLHPLTVTIWELVKLRVSQINQCAYCIDMHSKDALHLGESVERMYGLSAWRDMPFYSTLEKAALQWAELITSGNPVTDTAYKEMQTTLGDKGLFNLTMAVNAINSWNRIAKTFRPTVGSYKPN